MALVSLKNISKKYDNGFLAVDGVDLEIHDREFLVLVGPSGCGKTTTLRMIAGLEEITSGEMYIGDQLVNRVPPKDRDIAMVFQNYALYPHMTVYENMAFALKLKKMPKPDIKRKVADAAAILEITDLLDRRPKTLSGGQRQRVAIGRAIVRSPEVFLMDEPLSNLDAKLRNQMRAEILKIRRRIDTTFVYVTHDQTEAMTLGDRIVIMKDGVVQQVGTPGEVFDHPANLFVAGFIGTPRMNILDAALDVAGEKTVIQVEGISIPLNQNYNEAVGGCAVKAGVRPEYVRILPQGETGIKAVVGVSERTGSTINLHADIAGTEIIITLAAHEDLSRFEYGAVINVSFDGGKVHLFDVESGMAMS